MKRELITACIVMSGLLKANAQTPDTINISTGVNSSGSVLAVNTAEPKWMSSSALKTCYLSAWTPSSNARWISPNVVPSTGEAASNAMGTSYSYSMSFTPDNCPISGGTIRLNMLGGDNVVTGIKVNSTNHSISAGFNGSSSPVILSTATNITISNTEMTPGVTNTITVTLTNLAGSYSGLLVDGSLIINYTANGGMVNNLTAPASVCIGSAITVNGSTSTGPVGTHVFTVVECNSSGVAAPGATVWWSPFFTGMPGSYTIPSAASGGPTLICGKYYAVGMALQNACNVWVPNQKVVRIDCLPSPNAGADVTICNGSCTTIGTNMGITKDHFTWSTGATTQQITPCPTTTTTYTLTMTAFGTGCVASDAVTVTVLNNDPTFSWTVNTSSASYFTVSTTANDPYGYSYPYPGFTYSLNIEELNSGGTPLYNDGGTDAWWSYPTNDFKGFDGTVNPSGGSYTQTAWWTPMPIPAGKFLYGHNYRITRGTWNDVCSTPAYYAPIISAPPHMNILAGDKIKIYEGQDAIDFVEKLKREAIENASSDLNVYPNPSNGIFTIELSNSVKTNMEIYDMTGKKVKEEQVAGNYTLDLSGYSKGIYMIRMIINDQPVMKKIILE